MKDHLEAIVKLDNIINTEFIDRLIPLINHKAKDNLTVAHGMDKNIRNVKGYHLTFNTPTDIFYWNYIKREIERLLQQYNALPLTLEQFPISINPFSVEPEMPTAGMNLTGGTLPKLNTTLQGSNIGGINNLGTTLAKLEQVDKVFDL